MDPKTVTLRAFRHPGPLLVLAVALLTGASYAAHAQDGGNPSGTAIASPLDAAPPASAAAMEPVALEELIAPIALYPDALLGAMFAAAAHPQEVMDAGNWRLENPALEGPALDAAAEKAGFGPGTRALLAFPTVLDMMCQNFDWTQQLGAAFNADQGALMAAAQRLRAQALAAGNLASSPEQQVEQRTINEQQVVEIRPTTPTQVYVPQYNPEAVYTQPSSAPVQYVAVPGAPGVTQVVAGPSTGDLIAAGVIGFTTAVIIANIFNQNRYPADYYAYYRYPYPRWGFGFFYYDNRPWYARGYRYHPNYGYGGYRHGYRGGRHYHPPSHYPHVWNKPGPWHRPPPGYRPNTVVTVNTTQVTYFSRFGQNQNLSDGSKPRPALVAAPVRARVDVQYRPASRPPAATSAVQPGGTGRPSAEQGQPRYQAAPPPRNVPKISPQDANDKRPPASVEPVTQAQPSPGRQPTNEPAPRPAAQPTPRPAAQSKPQSKPQPKPRPTPQPAAQPAPAKDRTTPPNSAPKPAKSSKNQTQ